MALRKNQRWLTAGEKQVYIDAVLKLKAEKIGTTPPTNTYDKYVKMHDDFRDAGHKGPAFLAWHREFLRRFELELQRIMDDKTFGLPYWDWSVDQSEAPYPAPSWPFTPWFLGGDGVADVGGQVIDGAFAFSKHNWELKVRDTVDEPYPYLSRQFGAGNLSLPTPDDVKAALRATPFDVAPWNENSASGFRNMAEGWIPPQYNPEMYIPKMHNRVHRWVGGSMVPITSPNDPVFFLHHCFVDKLWADWQSRDWQTRQPAQTPYLPTNGARKGHNLGDYMPPWNTQQRQMVRPLDVLDHRKLGYRYETEDYLLPGEELYIGQWIWSANKKYALLYEGLERILWLEPTSANERAVWQSATTKQPLGRCIMRDDGNLVIYHTDAGPYDPNPIWESKTAGNAGSSLWVSDEGYLELYRPGATDPFWWKPGS
jgi:Common central domain of tyrosinase